MLTLLAIVSAPALVIALLLAPAVCLQLLMNSSFYVVDQDDDEATSTPSVRLLESYGD